MYSSSSYDCSIMNRGFSIDRDTKMAILLSPNVVVPRYENFDITMIIIMIS